MNILGLNAFHADAAACLVCDGRMVAAIAEERLGRRFKHFSGFPELAISRVLDIGGLTLEDVDVVAVGSRPSANLSAKIRYTLRNAHEAAPALKRIAKRRKTMRSRLADMAGVGLRIADRIDIVEVEHHLAHLASAYYCSGFTEAAAFSFDASGDFVSTMFGACTGSDIEIKRRIFLPHSLGYYYTAISQFIGFDRFGEEYKVMGLAAYGEPEYAQLMERIVSSDGDGGFTVDTRYFSGLLAQPHLELMDDSGQITIPPLYSAELSEELGPPRTRGAEITLRDRNIAAACQAQFESVALECVDWLYREVPTENLVMAGGCALNGVNNARVLRDSPFKRSYIQSAAGDDGTALGAALYVWNTVGGGTRSQAMYASSWGPQYDDPEIVAAIESRGLSYTRAEEPCLLDTVARHLAVGRIVAWYQGRSEWGPRALGHRSILAHPGWPDMKDIINRRVKRREPFRPFAPSILAEHVDEYFEEDIRSPFMMHVVRIREDKRRELQAVTHEDHTGRLHTVTREQNRLYYELISRFAELTGTPVVLNTSFNENEPIVDTPAQAIDCFLRNDLDVLCLGSLIVLKDGIESFPPRLPERMGEPQR